MSKNKSSADETSQPTFEESLAQVERVVRLLEGGTPDLADALAQYENAIKHLRNCQQWLTSARQKVELLTGVNADGEAITTPFETGTDDLGERAGTRKRTRKASAKSPNQETSLGSDADEDVDGSTQLF